MMNRQGSALFEAPLAHEVIQHEQVCNCGECRLNRELESGFEWEADPFETALYPGMEKGHEVLTERAINQTVAEGIPGIDATARKALLRGVTRPDTGHVLLGIPTNPVNMIGQQFVEKEQKRHALRKRFETRTQDALIEITGHLRSLHANALTAARSGNRRAAFEWIGEALHLIQDSFSDAHTQRTNMDEITGSHPILKVRFFGRRGAGFSQAPGEHQVFSPIRPYRGQRLSDIRDKIWDPDDKRNKSKPSVLTKEARVAIHASVDFLKMMLDQLRRGLSPQDPIAIAELDTFINWHLSSRPIPPRGSRTTPQPGPRPIPQSPGGRPVLHRGSRGSSVRDLQTRLNRWLQSNPQAGPQPLVVDGLFGQLTYTVVQTFQRSAGLTADGIVGPRTWARLPGKQPQPRPIPPSPQQNLLRGFFKDSAVLNNAPIAPTTPIAIAIDRRWPSQRRALAATYNRLGGLMQVLAQQLGIDVQSVLAVWQIESGGRAHTVNRAVIRFENHLFYAIWGKSNQSIYFQHFRYDPKQPWKGHQFRASTNEPFQDCHMNQAGEYTVLNFARQLAGDSPALQSISIGGPQILVSSFREIGYASPREMYDAFQRDERNHVLGFFDFCLHAYKPRPGDLINYLRARNWLSFARYYNGPGQHQSYASLLAGAYRQASFLTLT